MRTRKTRGPHGSQGRSGGPAARPALVGLAVVVLLLLSPAQALGAGWTRQHTVPSTHLNDVDFVDAQHGWVVGTGGVIVATTDGGSTWKSQTSGTTESLQAVDFVDASFGWAVGYKGTILKTADGGATWTKQTSGDTSHIYGVSFVSQTQGWASGYWGLILTTEDGGTTWTRVLWPFGQDVWVTNLWHDVAFADAGHGWMVGEESVARTTGAAPPWTWTTLGSSSETLNAIDYASATRAWAVGWSGTAGAVYATTDGTSWHLQATGSSEPLQDVSSPTANNVWLAGYRGTVFATTDGGATWKAESTGASLLDAIDFPDVLHGWALSMGDIYAYGQRSAKPVPKALANVTVKHGRSASLPYRVDSAVPTCAATIAIVRSGRTVKTLAIKAAQTNASLSATFKCTLAKGPYTWKVSAVANGAQSGWSASKKLTVK